MTGLIWSHFGFNFCIFCSLYTWTGIRHREMSRKTRRNGSSGLVRGQKHVRKRGDGVFGLQDVKRLLENLGHLVGSLSGGGKVQAYTQIADRLSHIAGMNSTGWSWRYVASVHSGSLEPGKKFLRVLELLLEEASPRRKQWFYFAHYHSVAAVYDKSLKREMITQHMKGLGYKAVSFMRYMELKGRAVARKK